MNKISIKEIDPLWAIIIISSISLFVAYITFGMLKSTGAINNETIQLGGAAAGFFAVFILINRSYSSHLDKSRADGVKKLEKELEEEKKKKTKPLTVNLKFDVPVEEVKDIQFKDCILEIFDENDQIIDSRKNISLTEGGEGAWNIQLRDIEGDFSAHMKIIDNKDRVWEVNKFSLYVPYQTTRTAIRR